MLICPVCRSQNMESAKYCGNCGHPFPRQADPVSTLVNCAQGHIYSAVYNHCPYCPQPPITPVAPTVKESETIFENPSVNEAGYDSRGYDSRSYETSFGDEEAIIAEKQSQEGARPESSEPPTDSGVGSRPLAGEWGGIPGERRSGSLPRGVESLPTNGSRPGEQVYRNGSRPISSRLAMGRPPAMEPNRPTSFEAESPGLRGSAGDYRGAAAPPERNEPGGRTGGEGGEVDRRTTVVGREVGAGTGSRGKLVGWLISYTSNPDGEDYRLYAGHNRIGANSICDIVINDDTVSGSHAILVYREGRCLIKDDLSRNGTFVNGREITEAHPLQNYDQVRLGNTYLIFVSAQRI